jgi:adenylate cyclase
LTCGLGLANGPAIVGRLGTFDQFKVDVFGPVVNLASRLESMTKILQVPILVDERVAEGLAREATSWAHCRRLARLRPYGMHRELLVSELLPPTGEPGAMTDRDRLDYEAGLDAFLAGRWQDASRLLDRLPQDGGARFLKAFMDRHEQRSPVGWDGIIPLEGK